ncbi:MAG: zf-HC2 domain-containing protein [Bryobacteraceae bacterium]
MCISDGVLRAKIDGELPEAELERVRAHLEQCARCREREQGMAERARRVAGFFSELAPAPGEAPADAAAAYARFHQERAAEPERKWRLGRLVAPRLRPAWGAAAAAALLGLAVVSPPGRALAQKVLGMLRIRAVVAVPMERDFAAEGKGQVLSQLLADSVVTTKESRQVTVSGREEAARLAGFEVRLPELLQDTPQLMVRTEHAFHFTVDERRLTTLVSAFGRPDLEFPLELNGARVFVDLPAAVVARYGDCRAEGWRESQQSARSDTCVTVMQAPAPTVVTLPELDLRAVAEFGLQLSGMSAEEARKFSQAVDWQSTLAIPIPRNVTSYETVNVDGAQGILVAGVPNGRRQSPPAYGLFWVKHGRLYGVTGFGGASAAVPLADSLR